MIITVSTPLASLNASNHWAQAKKLRFMRGAGELQFSNWLCIAINIDKKKSSPAAKSSAPCGDAVQKRVNVLKFGKPGGPG